MLASDERDADVRSRSSWLMNPFVSPVAAASCGIVMPRSFRSARSRLPTGTATVTPPALVALTCSTPFRHGEA